jgi:hypothetical protein
MRAHGVNIGQGGTSTSASTVFKEAEAECKSDLEEVEAR